MKRMGGVIVAAGLSSRMGVGVNPFHLSYQLLYQQRLMTLQQIFVLTEL